MAAAASTNTQIIFKQRPQGLPDPAQVFERRTAPLPPVGDGQVLVKTLFLSLDPAMRWARQRGWMDDRPSYMPPLKLGEVMKGSVVGEVVESKAPQFKPGDIVTGFLGWQAYSVVKPDVLTKAPPVSDPRLLLSAAGMTGLTAYFGLLDIGKPKAGETVLVSGAAGATGSVAGQIAKIKGCRVIGIAGTDEKCAWLKELGFDAAINYKGKSPEQLAREVKEAAPSGIDIYFDNVGGDILDVALAQLNLKGRVVLCGGISQYNATKPKGPSNYFALVVKRARMEGFLVFDYQDRYPQGRVREWRRGHTAMADLLQWVNEGKLAHRETVVEGLENAPQAFLKLFTGENIGKLMVQVAKPGAKL